MRQGDNLSDRKAKRKVKRISNSVVKNAKQDMMVFLTDLDRIPTDAEVLAWQHGYFAGINRASANSEKDK